MPRRFILTAALAALPFGLAAETAFGLLPPGLVEKQTSASKAELDRARMYAVMLGKAQGCGLDVHKELDAVGGWIDRNYSGDGHKALVDVVMRMVPLQAEMQQNDRDFTSCDRVKKAFQRVTWPM